MKVQIRYPQHGASILSCVNNDVPESALRDVEYQHSIIESLSKTESWDPWMRVNVLIGCLSGLGWEPSNIKINNKAFDILTVTFEST